MRASGCCYPVVGVATGIAAALLMRLLRPVQQLPWPALSQNFLQRVLAADGAHRVGVVLGAPLVAGAAHARRDPRPGDGPLQTATAADFVRANLTDS